MATVYSNIANKTGNLPWKYMVGSDPNAIPSQFEWPDHEKPCFDAPELKIPIIDIGIVLSGDPVVVSNAAKLVDEACRTHGFFMVVNHGVDPEVYDKALQYMDLFFDLQLSEKQNAQREVGEYYGYASSFIGRFASKLPWKETLSLRYRPDHENIVEKYMVNKLGDEFRDFGKFYQKYGDIMCKLSLVIMELLGIALGLDKAYLRNFYEDNDSILRLNNYPSCQQPELALGTGPHADPTSLTILQQDQVGGLQVLSNEQWHSISPVEGALVINIGDTLMALTNGIYKSCLHRAVVHDYTVRRSIVFFLSPRMNKPVSPPAALVSSENPRKYPDFTWETLVDFTMKRYRTDLNTLNAFSKWLSEEESNKNFP